MSVKDIKHKLILLKIKATLKLNALLHQNQLSSGEPIYKFGPLRNISKFLSAQKISIQLDGADKNKKEFIFELINLLGKHNIDVTLIEFEKIFDNEDIRKIASQNPNTNLTFRYIYQSYLVGANSELTYCVSTYCKILEKIEFLCAFAKENFKQVDEQVFFMITQLADYITFDDNYRNLSLPELKLVSNLESALLQRKTVCIGYSLALQRCLSNLGVECNIVEGFASTQAPNQPIERETCNHAWNQVKLGNNWYNVDVSWFSLTSDLDFVLADDDTFKYHYLYEKEYVHLCNGAYPNRQVTYEKMRNIKNVLAAYDLGKRDTFLQYHSASPISVTEPSKEPEKSYDSLDLS